MTSPRSKFAGGDQTYLRTEQYRDASRLGLRANLHAKYSTAGEPWFDWVASSFDLFAGARILEAGCGAGWLWAQSTIPVPPGVELTLTDLSDGMVEEATSRALATGRFASVDSRQADLQALPFADVAFDRVVANHMLYHLPDPERGVAELARVVRDDGIVIAATNGGRHMQELWAIRARIFGTERVDNTVEVFGAESGFPILRRHFDDVRWLQYRDELRCTDPDDVMAYVCSTPPAEDADEGRRSRLRAAIDDAFSAGDGAMTLSKDTGCFVCRGPSPS